MIFALLTKYVTFNIFKHYNRWGKKLGRQEKMSRLPYIVLTNIFEKEKDGRWTAYCEELGTETFANTIEEAQDRLKEMVQLHLNTLEDVRERERFFKENGIEIRTTRPPKSISIDIPINPHIIKQPFVQPLQNARA